MKKWILIVYCFSAGILTCAMEPVGVTALTDKENEHLFAGLESLVNGNLDDLPDVPQRANPYLDTRLASPDKLRHKDERQPLAQLSPAPVTKRTLFAYDATDKTSLDDEENFSGEEQPKKITKSYLCDQCSAPFRSQWHLNVHILAHKGIKPYKCPFCNNRQIQKSNLLYHLKNSHPDKPIDPEVIEAAFDDSVLPAEIPPSRREKKLDEIKTPSQLPKELPGPLLKTIAGSLESMQTTALTSPVDAPKVVKEESTRGKSSKRKSSPQENVMLGKKPVSKKIGSKKTLEPETHTPDSSSKMLICSECGKEFKKSSDLKDHIHSHNGLQPFACPYCPKNFTKKANRNSHIKNMHEGEPLPQDELVVYEPSFWPQKKYPYHCLVCHAGFERPMGLYTHQRHMKTNKTHTQLEIELRQTANTVVAHTQAPQESSDILEQYPLSLNFLGTSFHVSAPQKVQEHYPAAQQTPGTVAPQKGKASIAIPCPQCGQSFSTMIQYVDHKMDKKCVPVEPTHPADSSKTPEALSTTDKTGQDTSQPRLHTCPLSSCKKQLRGGQEYGSHVASHFLPKQ